MSEQVYNWTNKTSTGLLNEELQHLWGVVLDALVINVGELLVKDGASKDFTSGSNSQTRILFPETADSWSGITSRFPESWYGVNLTLEALITGAGTAGNFRLWWALGNGTANQNANGHTGNIPGPNSATLETLSTSIQISGSTTGRRITVIVGRDPDHIDDDIANDIGLFYIRIFPTP